MKTYRCHIKPYIQPFERFLAVQELSRVVGEDIPFDSIAGINEVSVSSHKPVDVLIERLAYWEAISCSSEKVPTTQALRESTVNIVRNGIDINELPKLLPFNGIVPLPNRRCLRYGTHGIHEYRGKFFPQLVRSLINMAGVDPGGIIADPMCGSGTTAVEAMLFGCKTIGLDVNPLSVFLASTKCRLLSAKPEKLAEAYTAIRNQLLATKAENSFSNLTYFNQLPIADREYLQNWFSEDVLVGLDEISLAIYEVQYKPAQDMMRIALSNIIRKVSWQKDADLRVRKEVRLDVELDPKREFLEELGRSVRAVLAFLYQNTGKQVGEFEITEANATDSANAWSQYTGKVDAVITSPPYATALPYLDTDRLSLYYLGLLSRGQHRERDQIMIGNREITDKVRRSYWERFQEHQDSLPSSVRDIITQINNLNASADVGFRRKNLPALLAKYFFDMTEVIKGIQNVLKQEGRAFIVVGNNHTTAGGQRVDIPTARLLSEIAAQHGLTTTSSISMEMLVSRDIFRNNAMASEEILVLRKE